MLRTKAVPSDSKKGAIIMDCINCKHFNTELFICASCFCPYAEHAASVKFVTAASRYDIML